jgi:hypothetical protein
MAEAAMAEKQTSDEALDASLKAAKSMLVRGSDWNSKANHIIARHVLQTELGRYSDSDDLPLPTYGLDGGTRDRLIVHARQDAAETLLQVNDLKEEVRGLKKAVYGLIGNVTFVLMGFILYQWWKSGVFARWLQ